MAKFCTTCGHEIEETTAVCPNCETPVLGVGVFRKPGPIKSVTATYIFYTALTMALTLTLWITSILESWIMEPTGENPYWLFWVGNDQYFAYFTTLVLLVLGILTFTNSNIEYKREMISRKERLFAIFMFVTSFFFVYIAVIGLLWQV